MNAKSIRLRSLGTLCALALSLMFSVVSPAVTIASQNDAPIQIAQNGSTVSAAEAAARIKKKTGGQVLSVTTVSTEAGNVHRVKILLSGGRVKVFRVKATGG